MRHILWTLTPNVHIKMMNTVYFEMSMAVNPTTKKKTLDSILRIFKNTCIPNQCVSLSSQNCTGGLWSTTLPEKKPKTKTTHKPNSLQQEIPTNPHYSFLTADHFLWTMKDLKKTTLYFICANHKHFHSYL